MPDFSVYASTPAAHKRHEAIDPFSRAYIEAALWLLDEADTDPEDGAYSADVARLSDDAYARAVLDCTAFRAANAGALVEAYTQDAVSYDETQAGHDYYLTRNGHGTGFWERGLGEVGDHLTAAAADFHEAQLYQGDDGLLYFSQRACIMVLKKLTTPSGTTFYLAAEGRPHRDDGPAVEGADGLRMWYREGRLHREGGPALETPTGSREWWRGGRLHRDDGPAVEWADGAREWWRDGTRHRDDGPAIETAEGRRYWYRNGKLHRDDGPAIELPDGRRFWYRDGLTAPEMPS